MKKILAALLLFPLALLAQRGMVPVSVEINGQLTPLYQESHALLVGVSRYTNGWSSLRGVDEDIPAVQSALERNGFSVTVVMNPEDVTAMKRAIDQFISQHGNSENNRLLFYFALHGHTIRMSYGGSMGYLCPGNVPDPSVNPDGFVSMAFPMDEIDIYARKIKSKHALFLFDACFAGQIFSTSRAAPEVIQYKTKDPVRQFITSGDANETVADESLFRRLFIRALDGDADRTGDGYLTGSELGLYLQENVVNLSNGTQHPQYGKIRNIYLDKGDFVFVLKPGTTMQGDRGPVVTEEKILVQYGKLELTTHMSGELYIDGVRIQSVTAGKVLAISDLTSGSHTIGVKGEETVEKEVVIPAGGVATLTIDKKRATDYHSWLPEVVWVEGGTFQMGSTEGDDDEKPVHQVTVSSFYMGKYEVTVKQFGYFIGKTGYRTEAEKGDGSYIWTGSAWEKRAGVNWRHDERGSMRGENEANHPVVHVSWNDAVAYCEWISRETGKSYRLPTEAEWEYAAGNGPKHTRYSWGNSDPYGKWGGNVADETAKRSFPSWKVFSGYSDGYVYSSPVGSFEANEFGLHDMSGNVWEWCSDWYGGYPSGSQVNPSGATSGSYRVSRGGSWFSDPQYCRSSDRRYGSPDNRNGILGFRLVLVP